MNRNYVPWVLLAIVLVAGLSLPVSAETLLITPSSASVLPGSSTTFLFSMDGAPAGISGYLFRISLSNPAVGEITGVTYPSWVSVNETTGVPSDSVTVAGADLGEAIQDGATTIPFGSVTVRGDSVGTSNLVLDVLKLDADGGDSLAATVSTVTLTVKSSSSGGGGGGGGGGGSSYDVSTTVPTTTPTTRVTIQPTTTVEESIPTSMPASGRDTPTVTQETTAVPSAPAASASGDLPFNIPWAAVIVVLAIMVVAAVAVLYLAITKRI